MNLLVIGQGAWASKIQSVLSNSTTGIQATSISARNALKDSLQLDEAVENSDVIWICTKPDWQLELLPRLHKFDGKLVLEKPYIIDKNSLNRFTEFRTIFKGVLQLSEPWTFSNIWHAAKKEIKESSSAEFMIRRGGSTGHSYISAVMDWLPHDINLLYDLYGNELLQSTVSDIHWKENRSELDFKISMEAEKSFLLKVGKFQGNRDAFWKSKDLTVNFLTSTLTKGSSEVPVIQEINPFILQVSSMVENSTSKTQDQLEVQNYFFDKLLK
jgi:hypothetical protein